MRKLLIRFLDRVVVWMLRKMNEDTFSEKEAKRILRDIQKMIEENKVK